MTEEQPRAGEITAPVDLVMHIPGSDPVTARVGHIELPLPEDGVELDEQAVGVLIADFLASAADCYRKEGPSGDTTVR